MENNKDKKLKKISDKFISEIIFIKRYNSVNKNVVVDFYDCLADHYFKKSQLEGISEDQLKLYDEIISQINRLKDNKRNEIIKEEETEVENSIKTKEDENDDNFDVVKLTKVYDNNENYSLNTALKIDELYNENVKSDLIGITYNKAVEAGFFKNIFDLYDQTKEEINLLKYMPDLYLRLEFANILKSRYEGLLKPFNDSNPEFDVYTESIDILEEYINNIETRIFVLEENYIQGLITEEEEIENKIK